MKFKKVGVLLGGLSAEREVSLTSGNAVADGLERSGYQVVRIDVTNQLDLRLREADVEAAFIALHGRFGEDGTVQGMLEMLKIPYTGSGVLASALAMDKAKTRDLLSMAGLHVASGMVVCEKNPTPISSKLGFPVVVKPVCEGSSVGVSIARNTEELSSALDTAFSCSKQVLVEQFVAGTEVNVAVLDEKVLGSVEIEPHREFYDFHAKYGDKGSTHHIPPRISKDKIEEAHHLGKRAYEILGCSGAARVDLIIPRDAPSIILEVNTIPGMTPKSLLPEIAAASGLPFDRLVASIMERARLHVG